MSSCPVQNRRAARERRVFAALTATALGVGAAQVVQSQVVQAGEPAATASNEALLKKVEQMEQRVRVLEGQLKQKDAKEIAHARAQADAPADAKWTGTKSADTKPADAKPDRKDAAAAGKPDWVTAVPVTRDLTGKTGPVNAPNTLLSA
jgi:hypothetical protein